MKEYKRMIAGLGVIGMIRDISFKLPTTLKEHLPANLMECAPLLIVRWRPQFVFEFDHWLSMIKLS